MISQASVQTQRRRLLAKVRSATAERGFYRKSSPQEQAGE
jgi:hypothetical protein